MATLETSSIKIRRHTGSAGFAPSTLLEGELAINLVDGYFYYGTQIPADVRSTFSFDEVTASNLIITNTASISYLHTTYESSSIIYSSGSTKFGDSSDDTHIRTGSAYWDSNNFIVSGTNGVQVENDVSANNLSSSNDIYASNGNFLYDADGISGLEVSGEISASNISASGDINVEQGTGSFHVVSASEYIGLPPFTFFQTASDPSQSLTNLKVLDFTTPSDKGLSAIFVNDSGQLTLQFGEATQPTFAISNGPGAFEFQTDKFFKQSQSLFNFTSSISATGANVQIISHSVLLNGQYIPGMTRWLSAPEQSQSLSNEATFQSGGYIVYTVDPNSNNFTGSITSSVHKPGGAIANGTFRYNHEYTLPPQPNAGNITDGSNPFVNSGLVVSTTWSYYDQAGQLQEEKTSQTFQLNKTAPSNDLEANFFKSPIFYNGVAGNGLTPGYSTNINYSGDGIGSPNNFNQTIYEFGIGCVVFWNSSSVNGATSPSLINNRYLHYTYTGSYMDSTNLDQPQSFSMNTESAAFTWSITASYTASNPNGNVVSNNNLSPGFTVGTTPALYTVTVNSGSNSIATQRGGQGSSASEKTLYKTKLFTPIRSLRSFTSPSSSLTDYEISSFMKLTQSIYSGTIHFQTTSVDNQIFYQPVPNEPAYASGLYHWIVYDYDEGVLSGIQQNDSPAFSLYTQSNNGPFYIAYRSNLLYAEDDSNGGLGSKYKLLQ